MDRLFILPFDHRSTFAEKLLGFKYPVKTAAQLREVSKMKSVVFDGFMLAHNQYEHSEDMGILIDEEFGSHVIKACQKQMIPFAMSVEQSGQLFFQFKYGNGFGKHLKETKRTV